MNPSRSHSVLDLASDYCLFVTPILWVCWRDYSTDEDGLLREITCVRWIAWLSRPYLVLGDRYVWKEEAEQAELKGDIVTI